jgi:hypothetical protein
MKCEFRDVELSHGYSSNGGEYEIKTIGLDSEAYTTGEPFLFCFSDGRHCHAKDIFETIFQNVYEGVKFVVFNLKYEQGALFYHIPADILAGLREYGRCEWEGYKITTIDNKEVKISRAHKTRYFYDVYPYYGTSLDKASARYLGDCKISSTKRFTPNMVARDMGRIIEYCTKDATLTKQLADLFISNLHKLKLYPRKLISTGYISGVHFAAIHNCNINKLYSNYPGLIEAAWDSYNGGMFQVFKRGRGKFYQYDINSAYPAQIAKLKTLERCEVFQGIKIPKCDFGFVDCEMLISSRFSPITVKVNNLNIYPQGYIRRWITLLEYEYLKSRGNDIKVYDGWYIRCRDEYPYKQEIERLYRLKSEYKGNDDMQYLLVKILLNSLYGKFLQITETFDKDLLPHFRAGMLFNPVYAAYITAGTRVELCNTMDFQPRSVCAVHTDSVITDKPLPLVCDKSLGGWDFVSKGMGYIIGSGVYSIGRTVHFRGFDKKLDLNRLIKNSRNGKVEITTKLATTWRQSIFRGSDDINLFTDDDKMLDLNFDKKRVWKSRFNRNRLSGSNPIILLK